MSSQAFCQGGGRQIDSNLINTLRTITPGDFEPDFYLYLDIDPAFRISESKRSWQARSHVSKQISSIVLLATLFRVSKRQS